MGGVVKKTGGVVNSMIEHRPLQPPFLIYIFLISRKRFVNKPILNALQKKVSSQVPFWFMRQAGRYLPEYRAARADAGSFLDLCYNPELASEVTLQPIRRFGMDGAILFSDILVLPHALGVDVRFAQGEGPILDQIHTQERIDALDMSAIQTHCAPVFETIRRVKKELPAHVTMLGFAGAPFTVAAYMVEGKGSKEYNILRAFFYKNPELFQRIIDVLTDATIIYLSAQIEAGAEAVQLFDSWAGVLSPERFETYCIKPNQRIVATLKKAYPHIPIICFPRGAGAKLSEFCAAVECDAVSIDTSTSLEFAKKVAAGKTIQGNLDPMLLLADTDVMLKEAALILDVMRGYPFIFNLGHGFTPETKIENVEALCNAIRSYK